MSAGGGGVDHGPHRTTGQLPPRQARHQPARQARHRTEDAGERQVKASWHGLGERLPTQPLVEYARIRRLVRPHDVRERELGFVRRRFEDEHPQAYFAAMSSRGSIGSTPRQLSANQAMPRSILVEERDDRRARPSR